MDLNKLDRLVLAQKENDETNKLKNWYLAKVNPSDINAFILRKNKESIMLKSKYLTSTLLKYYECTERMKFLIAKNPIEDEGTLFYQLIPIIKD